MSGEAVAIPAGAVIDPVTATSGSIPIPAGASVEGSQPTSTIGPPTALNAEDLNVGASPVQQVETRLSLPLIKGLMAAHDKLRDVQNMTQEGREQHPIQAKIGDLANNIEELLTGGQSAGKPMGTSSGVLNNPVTAAIGAAPELAEGAEAATGALRGARGAASGGEEAPGIVKQVLKGKSVEQEPAKAAVRTMARAPEEAPMIQGSKTVMSDALQNVAKARDAAYSKVDKAAGFDIRETQQTLRDAQFKIKQPEIDDAAKARLQDKIDAAQKSLADAATKVGPDELNAADALHKQVNAGKDIQKMIIQQSSPDGQSVNVDGLLNASKKLRFTKYGDRLAQWFGDSQKADDFMARLQQAQDLGAHAIKTQNLAKWIGGIIGAGAIGTGISELASIGTKSR